MCGIAYRNAYYANYSRTGKSSVIRLLLIIGAIVAISTRPLDNLFTECAWVNQGVGLQYWRIFSLFSRNHTLKNNKGTNDGELTQSYQMK